VGDTIEYGFSVLLVWSADKSVLNSVTHWCTEIGFQPSLICKAAFYILFSTFHYRGKSLAVNKMVALSRGSILISQPLINSIPDHLVPRFDPIYVEWYNKYNAGRLATHQVPIEAYRKDPMKYTIAYGRQIVDQGNLKITDQRCPVDGGGITVRVIEPDPEVFTASPRPVYINFRMCLHSLSQSYTPSRNLRFGSIERIS
jgi:hypothetical protein